MNSQFRSQDENPTGRNRPYYGTWAKQFPSPTAPAASTSQTTQKSSAPSAANPVRAARDTWAKQFSATSPSTANQPAPARDVWNRQFAPKPAASTAVPARTAIPQTFATSRTPAASVSLGVKLSGIRGCAIAPATVDSIRTLIRSGKLENLIEAREQIETLPSDHADGWKLVHELFDALGKLTNTQPDAA